MPHPSLLPPGECRHYQSLTFPAYRNYLTEAAGAGVIAMGISDSEFRPAALGLAQLNENGMARVLSLYVRPALRRRGLAARLLAGMEAEARKRGAQRMHIQYLVNASAPALEALLARRQWLPPRRRSLLFRGNHYPWDDPRIRRFRLPADCEAVPWGEITVSDREQLAALVIEEPTLPAIHPKRIAADAEPAVSLLLRYRGVAAGWLLAHRVKPKEVRVTGVYVSPRIPHLGVGPALLNESRRRQEQVFGSDVTTTAVALLRPRRGTSLWERCYARYTDYFGEFRESRKHLNAVDAATRTGGLPIDEMPPDMPFEEQES